MTWPMEKNTASALVPFEDVAGAIRNRLKLATHHNWLNLRKSAASAAIASTLTEGCLETTANALLPMT